MTIQKIKSGRVTSIDADTFVGPPGTLFFNEDQGDLRLGDGVTPGGIPLSFGGEGGGNYVLPTATTTVKGGVKIDGSTIAIANQVISVGTVPYSSISGTPTIPTNNNQLTNGAAYITSSALSTYALSSSVPTNNNQLTNGAAYITSAALSGLASETYVTTRGYLTTVAYADVTNKPTLFSGSYVDLTNKPTIPTDINQLTDASGLLGQGGGGGGTTYITNTVENPYSFSIAGDDSTLREIASGESIKITGAGGITVTTDAEGNLTVTGTPVSLAGYATESYVTSRGYITGLSYNDLTDKPNLAGTYTFNVAADDSTMREISSEETVKFVGAGGITTASDAEGKITITQGTTSSLVNGANTVSLGSTGILTFPNGALTVTGNKIRNVNEIEGLIAGSQLEVALAKTVITHGTTSYLGDPGGTGLTSQYLVEVGTDGILNAFQVINTLGDGDGGLTSEVLTELDNTGFKIGQRVTNDLGGDSEPLVAFSGWTFGTVGQSQAITFPDATVQTTAWNGTVSQLRSESNINIEVNLTDSTKRTWQFGEDGYLTLPDDRGINSSANINIAVDTPDSSTFNWQFGNDGYLTLPNDRGITASTNLNISVATPDSTTLNWQFGNDGALTLPGPGKITNGDYDWKFDSDGFFNAASILTLGNSENLYIDRVGTSQGFGYNLKQRGFRIDLYDTISSTRKIASGLISSIVNTADPASTDYYDVTALLLPNLAANENFTVGIQMPTLNPFAAGWMAAYPDDAKQYKFRLIFQATYVIQGVTYNFAQSYTSVLETFGDSSSPELEEYISTSVYPIPDNNFIPGGSEFTATVNLDLNPLVAGYVTMRNFGTAFAKANGAAGLVPTQLLVSAGFSKNLDAAVVWGRANTGTTVTDPNTNFEGIAYYQSIVDNAIVTDVSYMQLVLGQGYLVFQPNNIALANGTNIGENLNGSVAFGSRSLENSLGAVAIGTGYGTIGDYAVAVGGYAGTDSGNYAVAVGNNAGISQGESAVAIGRDAGSSQGAAAVAVGSGAGTSQGANAVAVGNGSGNLSGDSAVAIGPSAGNTGQNAYAVAVGANAGSQSQGATAVAMGFGAGFYGQRDNAVAIGTLAGAGTVYAQAGYVAAGSTGTTLMISRAVYSTGTIVPGMMIQATGFSNQTVVAVVSATQLTISAAPDTAPVNGYPLQFFKGQGANSIAIGNQAGSPANDLLTDFQESNTIILNATGTSLIGVDGQENSFYVAPIRNASGADGVLQYNLSSKEVTYGKLSYNDLINKPDLAATYTWSIAADDSTLREILANETVKFIGAGSITTASDAEGNITITGAAPDRLTSNARSAVLNSNGTFSLPTLTAAPTSPQAGQMALADGVSWDPIAQNNGAPYMVIYTGSAWIGMGGVTVDQVYNMILEMT